MPEIIGLPNKELLRIDEVANYFSVSDRTIRLWIEHGHLLSEKIVGSIRVTRESVLACRFAKKLMRIQSDIGELPVDRVDNIVGVVDVIKVRGRKKKPLL